ncbi:aldolase [Variovorax paradoxus]|jgi:ribulose-5-phosphate 4-epimerase/fuculose-1-phosphate aldolase|uniref:class II aldolase/adducin family protein n=1 Tax=Variovorax TaxID=34072 RepID=UPI0006E5B97B|nr:class II aldolase/adducin family protein [Variovorax sp.]KPU97542.1 aldolase [Variovorax paradoxus]KPV06950.1 aldolase [Variovorax paradoxus]KPV07171.1 aldolase [Variovorax paradoxus]KPV20710.1 aldolase [Variovorax paradoxus]KPV31360.1 aldolase [Variovorax paradoxus]
MNGSGFSFAHTRAAVSDAEWRQRVDLAAAFRLAGYYRMTDQIYTHLTAKVPGTQAHFLINPYGVLFDEVTASCLVKVDIDGEVVFDPTGIGINPAGFLIHSCIHRARPDLHAVLHTHTAAGIAVAAQRRGLLNLSQHAMRFHRRIGYHDYEGVALDFSEQDRLVRDLGPHNVMILRNHGLLAAGDTIREAFERLYYLERACEAQVRAQSGGAELIECSDEIAEKVAQALDRPGRSARDNDWPALRRLLDRIDPSYAT